MTLSCLQFTLGLFYSAVCTSVFIKFRVIYYGNYSLVCGVTQPWNNSSLTLTDDLSIDSSTVDSTSNPLTDIIVHIIILQITIHPIANLLQPNSF